MRKGRNKKNDLIIDLTSLLDVIFIILLIVLCSQQLTKSKFEVQEQIAIEKIQETEIISELYKDQMEINDNLHDYVFAISVSSDYNQEQLTIRKIHILKKNQEPEDYELKGEDIQEVLQKVKLSLSECIQANSDQPVILSFNEDDEKILYRDEQAIIKIFTELSQDFSNVYIKNRVEK